MVQTASAPRTALVGATFLWGANLTISKDVLEVLSPFQLMVFRWVPALVIIGILAFRFEGITLPKGGGEWVRVAASSLFGAAGYSLFLYLALRELTPNQVAVMGALNPLIILAASAMLYRTRTQPVVILGMIIAVAGVGVMFAGPALLSITSTSSNVILGVGWMLIALTSWTIFTLVGAKSKTPPLTSTTIQAILTILVAGVVLSIMGELELPSMGIAQWLSFLFVAIGATTIAFVLWLSGVQRLGAPHSGPFLNLVPVFAVVVGVAFGHQLSGVEFVGIAITLAGTLLSTVSASRTRLPE